MYENEKLRKKLLSTARFVLSTAERAGATDAEVGLTVTDSISSTVRLGEVEGLSAMAQSPSLVLRVFVGQSVANVNTTDLKRNAIKAMVERAVDLAKSSEPDPDSGLTEAIYIAHGRSFLDLGLFDPSIAQIKPTEKIKLALAAESAAMADKARIVNSGGADFSDSSTIKAYANSRGFADSIQTSSCSLSVSVIAGQGGEIQSDGWWHQTRSFAALESPESIGQKAAQRAISHLGARRVQSQKCPVVFDPSMAASLISSFAGAANGESIYRKNSYLVDRLGSLVANPNVTLIDDPHMTGGLGSRLWGPEGITMKKRIIVDGGRLEQYFLDGYAARKLNTSPNGGHVSNFYLQNGSVTPADIIKSVKNGLFLTATSGHGFNIVTGDYSYGASGMWIENGELAYPVDKITVAGNMLDILNSIEAVGNDLEYRSSISAPTILIGSMSIGGT